MKKICLFVMLSLFAKSITLAQVPPPPSPWAHESEVAVVTVDGNTKTSSYSGKQKTAYTFGISNSIAVTGRYLEAQTRSLTTAKSWDAGTRYERALSDLWALFVGHQAASDTFSGYIQRDTTDVGAKYFIKRKPTFNWHAELGYSYIKTLFTNHTTTYNPSYRIYTEVSKTFENNVSLKYWIEYQRSFSDTKVYFANTEASVNVMLTDIFSLKTAYLVKYQNDLRRSTPPKTEFTDSQFTTSLVAKF